VPRHRGHNGYCTYMGNERFAWFASTESKSRINFLELLQAERRYAVNAEALAYMAERGLAADHRELLAARPVDLGAPSDWAAHLRRLGVESPRAVTLATEGALIGGLAAQGFNLDLGLISDGAGQFDLFVHGLCWVHAERPLSRLVPLNESDRRAIAWVRQQVWFLYRDLKAYRRHPDPAAKERITAGFEALCATETTSEPLNQVLRGLQRNQAELLRVLDRLETMLVLCEFAAALIDSKPDKHVRHSRSVFARNLYSSAEIDRARRKFFQQSIAEVILENPRPSFSAWPPLQAHSRTAL
jgi:hypothetical protein